MDEIKEAPEKQTFVIDDDNKANWAFRKLAEVKQELDIKAQQKSAFDKQTQEWYESETKPLKESQDSAVKASFHYPIMGQFKELN